MKPERFPFLKLPLELREMVYHYVLLGSPREETLGYDIDDSILRTCKQIHAEGRPYLYKCNFFEVAIWLPLPGYRPWPVLSLNQNLLSRVQHLALYWDMRQFGGIPLIRFESEPLRASTLSLKRICIALLYAGTRLRTLKLTMKIPGGIDFGHMPLGQYPLLPVPARPAASEHAKDPDILAPLKELRVQQAIFAGDFSEATGRTLTYLDEVKAIMEGYKPKNPWFFPETDELDLDLMVHRNLYYYSSPNSHPSWEGIMHRELFFYAEAIRAYHIKRDILADESTAIKELDSVRTMLGNPSTEKPKGITKVSLGPVLLLLEDVYNYVSNVRKMWKNQHPTQSLLAAREYFMARPEIQKMMEDARSAAPILGLLDIEDPRGPISYFAFRTIWGRRDPMKANYELRRLNLRNA